MRQEMYLTCLSSLAILSTRLLLLAPCYYLLPGIVHAKAPQPCAERCHQLYFQQSMAGGRCNPIEWHETNLTSCLCADQGFIVAYTSCVRVECPGRVTDGLLDNLVASCLGPLNARLAFTPEEIQELGVYPSLSITTMPVPISDHLPESSFQYSIAYPPTGTLTQTPTSTAPESAAVPKDAEKGHAGLSRSDKVAIGVGLGVGIPSLVIAFLTYRATRRWGKFSLSRGVKVESQDNERADKGEQNSNTRVAPLSLDYEEVH